MLQFSVLKQEIVSALYVTKLLIKKLNVMKKLVRKNARRTRLFLLASVLILASCTVIKPGFNGVLNKPFGKGLVSDKIYDDGFYNRGIFTSLIKYDVRLKSYQEQISILTSDELHTKLALSVTVMPIKAELPQLILEIGENYYENIVKPNFYSISRGVIAKYNYEEISTKSLEIEKIITTELTKQLEGKHIYLDKVTLDHILYSPIVTNATDIKLATKQKLEQASIEVKIAEKEAEIQRINAEGQRDAQQIIDKGLTQRYLQFKALEVQDKLAGSNNAKFFFVPIGKDGLPIIIDANSN
jgi:regulator of protease activity HflC (stomatin/prohibitin superfamily)